jgi:transglutaminase-like putative cysteine protease
MVSDDLTVIWKDPSTFEVLKARGVCDEKAIVAITALRSIDIPARLKLFLWRDPQGVERGHACLEFYDLSCWVHMDPTYALVDEPEFYQSVLKVTQVRVIDADFPLDTNARGDWMKIPDPDGDRILQPADFIQGAPVTCGPRSRY